MPDNKKPKAWKNGKYTYCLTHGRSQVATSEDLYEDDPMLYEGRKCDFCGKKLA